MKRIYSSPEATINQYEPSQDITASGIENGGANTDDGWGEIID